MPTRKNPPIARVEQLIRAPLPAVFAAFTQPQELKKFWLAGASGPLAAGKTVLWRFKVRGARDTVNVVALEPDRRIRLRWSDGSTTEWTFTALGRKQTRVTIEQAGFSGRGDAVIAQAVDSAQGFAFVLSDLKVLLERRLRSGIVKDKALVIERALRARGRKT